jgi:4-diphosphocytidyl-2-C-methyl-D-erythritol kinase
VRELYDTLDVEPIAHGVVFSSSGIAIDCPEDKNLCVRAARLMQERYGVGGVAISLDKRVPYGACLGGGSSDATAVIMGLNEIFELGLDEPTLISLASELGSDTAFFVRNTPQLCTGRGEIMTPISLPLEGLWLAVVKSVGEGVSTAEAYGGVSPAEPNIPLEQRLQLPINEWQTVVKNDFEPHIFRACPIIKQLKNRLLDAGAIFASMSGSGSAVFGLFTERPTLNFDPFIFTHIEQL